MSKCQKYVKCQKVKHTDYGGGSHHIIRFTYIDVNFDVKYEGHQNCSKTLCMHILRVFGHYHMWHQNWHQYVWTSLCQFIFFVNLLHSPCVWLFDIWHLFDNLTSFWQLDIFFDIWAMGNVGKWVSWLILKIEMGHLGGWAHGWWGTWPMGHMGNWAHDHNFLNTAWIFTKILLHIDIDVFYLNILCFLHDGPF